MLNGKLENDLVSDCAYLFLISLFVYSFVRMKLFLFLCVYALAYVIRLHLNPCIHVYNSFISLQRPSNAVQVCRLHSCQRTAHMHYNRLKILHSFAVHYAAHNS